MVAIDADSALIVDCPSRGIEEATRLLRQLDPARLDVVVTHQDLDHCDGIPELLRLFGKPSTTLYMNPVGRPRPEGRPVVRSVLRSLLSALEEIGACSEHAFAGRAASTGGIAWSVLAPPYPLVLGAALLGGSVNRLSVVLMLQIRDFKFLIPGDIDDVAVNTLLISGTQLSADVFLLPHHGARLKTISRLLAAADPKYAVVSAGRRKTHPHIETLSAAAAFSCRLMCTQVTHHCHPDPVDPKHCAGSIVFDLSGGSLSVDPSPATHLSRINQFATPVCLAPSLGSTATGTTGGPSKPGAAP